MVHPIFGNPAVISIVGLLCGAGYSLVCVRQLRHDPKRGTELFVPLFLTLVALIVSGFTTKNIVQGLSLLLLAAAIIGGTTVVVGWAAIRSIQPTKLKDSD